MNREVLQNRIDEYNEITSKLVDKIRKNLYNIDAGFIKDLYYDDIAEFQDFKCNLEALYQHSQKVNYFLDMVSNTPFMIKRYRTLYKLLPDYPKNQEIRSKWIDKYDLLYSLDITSILHIIN